MSEYKHLLKHSESFDSLFKKVETFDIFYQLTKDLIEDNLEEFLKYNYIRADFTKSNEEFVFQYLSSVDFSLKRAFKSCIDKLFEFYVKMNNCERTETYISKLITLNNLNLGSIGEKNLFDSLNNKSLSINLVMKIWHSIVKFEKETNTSVYKLNKIEKIIRTELYYKSYLLPILLKLNLPNNPQKSLKILSELKYDEIKLTPEFRLGLFLQIRELIEFYFDLHKTKHSDLIEKFNTFSNLTLAIESDYVKTIIFDVLHLNEFMSLLEFINEYSSDYIIDLKFTFKERAKIMDETLQNIDVNKIILS